MIDSLYQLYDIPPEERRYLILATPRTGSSSFQRSLKICTDLDTHSPEYSPFDEDEFLKGLEKYKKGVITKIDPCKQSEEFLDSLIPRYHRVVVIIRENIVDHALSNTRAGLYHYDGVYDMDEETEKKVQHKRLKPTVIASAMSQTSNALRLAIKHNIPIFTYETLFNGIGEDLWKTLKEFGIKWKDIGDEKFNKVQQLMHPGNKYTNKNSILKNTKGEIKFI